MLVLNRKIEEGFKIGDHIEIKILNVFTTDSYKGKKTKVASIGINAPREISILRKELVETQSENKEAQLSTRQISASLLAGVLKTKRDINKLD